MMYIKKYLLEKLAFLKWSREYDGHTALSDVVGGVTIGLTLIPQVIAYAAMAGLEPQYGLYASIWGGIIYLFLGTIPEVSVAPTAILSLLTNDYIKDVSFDRAKAAVLMCFLSGCIQLVCGIFHLGVLTNFVSSAVVSGFTSAAALTIATSQIKNLIGIRFKAGQHFFNLWKHIFLHMKEYKTWDTILGLSCCIFLLIMRKLKDYGAPFLQVPGEKPKPIGKRLLWLLSLSKNALVVIMCAVLAYSLDERNKFSLTGKVPTDWPNVSLPVFEIEVGNKTVTFKEIISEIGVGVIFIPFVDMLSIVGIGKSFAQGKVLDASQEMLAVGMCNVVGSFFSAYPISASFSRAAVARASGVKTPFAGIYTATMVLLAFTLLTPYFPYIPRATLAAVIICAIIFMIDFKIVPTIWAVNKLDLIPLFATFISCLIFGLEFGILIGILVDLIKFLVVSSMPLISVETENINLDKSYITINLILPMHYFSIEHVRAKILKEMIVKGENYQNVALDFSRIVKIDYTTALVIQNLVRDLNKNGKQVILVKVNEQISKQIEFVCGEKCNIFPTYQDVKNYLVDMKNNQRETRVEI